MKPMRRQDRKITAPEEIIAMIQAEKVCRLALTDEEGPYLIPLNFGYAIGHPEEGGIDGFDRPLTLYFHSASSGRKIDAMQQNPVVAFVIDGAHALVESEWMTEYSYHYQSVLGRGRVRFLTDPKERMQAMLAIMRQQSGLSQEDILAMPRDEHWMSNKVMAVFAVEVFELSAKRHQG